jgi:hypothetical protein
MAICATGLGSGVPSRSLCSYMRGGPPPPLRRPTPLPQDHTADAARSETEWQGEKRHLVGCRRPAATQKLGKSGSAAAHGKRIRCVLIFGANLGVDLGEKIPRSSWERAIEIRIEITYRFKKRCAVARLEVGRKARRASRRSESVTPRAASACSGAILTQCGCQRAPRFVVALTIAAAHVVVPIGLNALRVPRGTHNLEKPGWVRAGALLAGRGAKSSSVASRNISAPSD